jgi:cell division septum initiation protein DivIVA
MLMTQDTSSQPTTGAAQDAHPPAPAVNGSHSAAHLLEITARDAELWVAEARSEAAALVDKARAEAEALVAEARTEAARVRAELEEARRGSQAELAELERLATQHRDQLRRHLTDLLAQVSDPAPEDG